MPLELYNTHHDVKKDYHWYINHPNEFHRLMANRRRDVVHHMRHFQMPKKQPVENPSEPLPEEKQQNEMTPASQYPLIDVEEQ